jgi:hypothetical protein
MGWMDLNDYLVIEEAAGARLDDLRRESRLRVNGAVAADPAEGGDQERERQGDDETLRLVVTRQAPHRAVFDDHRACDVA